MNRLRTIFCALLGHRSIVLKIDVGNIWVCWRIKLLCERCGTIRSLRMKDPKTLTKERKDKVTGELAQIQAK